jgi:uncharacterized repeat protein (TIGR03837 family)
MHCDIFCKVIDNHGDIGVCWRLSAGLASRGNHVRLRVNDASALSWMAPQGAKGVEVLPWHSPGSPGDLVIEAFGCELPEQFQAAMAEKTRSTGRQPAWVNLEYLTAERFAQRCHGLPSPVMVGPAAGLSKRFFYPGFTPGTGGLLREAGLLERQRVFDAVEWLRQARVPTDEDRRVSLFCYEPAQLPRLLADLGSADVSTRLLVTAGRATTAVLEALSSARPGPALAISYLPLLAQDDFDHLLWSCDMNFVRGEDSLVRALWAAKPFVWQLYPQADGVHIHKLDAFLDWLQPPPDLADIWRKWNGEAGGLPPIAPARWIRCADQANKRLIEMDDLVTQLLRFVNVAFPP